MNDQPSNLPTGLFWIIAFILGGLGLVFLLAAGQGNALIRIVIGGACLVGSAALIYLARMRPVQYTHVHKMELDMPGKVDMKSYECKSCGATLDAESVQVVAGAVKVNCPYCGTSYDMEEAPKW